jgi:hypothetical protein
VLDGVRAPASGRRSRLGPRLGGGASHARPGSGASHARLGGGASYSRLGARSGGRFLESMGDADEVGCAADSRRRRGRHPGSGSRRAKNAVRCAARDCARGLARRRAGAVARRCRAWASMREDPPRHGDGRRPGRSRPPRAPGRKRRAAALRRPRQQPGRGAAAWSFGDTSGTPGPGWSRCGTGCSSTCCPSCLLALPRQGLVTRMRRNPITSPFSRATTRIWFTPGHSGTRALKGITRVLRPWGAAA